jgi:hypothetical protein
MNLTTVYNKTEFNLSKRTFFLYEPIQAQIITRNGEEIIRAIDGSFIDYVKTNSNTLVRNFKANAKNMLLRDYVPEFVIYEEWFFNRAHKNCKVLPNKVGGYIMVKCLDCGEEKKIAMNSGIDVLETNKISCKDS